MQSVSRVGRHIRSHKRCMHWNECGTQSFVGIPLSQCYYSTRFMYWSALVRHAFSRYSRQKLFVSPTQMPQAHIFGSTDFAPKFPERQNVSTYIWDVRVLTPGGACNVSMARRPAPPRSITAFMLVPTVHIFVHEPCAEHWGQAIVEKRRNLPCSRWPVLRSPVDGVQAPYNTLLVSYSQILPLFCDMIANLRLLQVNTTKTPRHQNVGYLLHFGSWQPPTSSLLVVINL